MPDIEKYLEDLDPIPGMGSDDGTLTDLSESSSDDSSSGSDSEVHFNMSLKPVIGLSPSCRNSWREQFL